jgi:hypothetical protein
MDITKDHSFACEKIRTEITQDIAEVRDRFVIEFKDLIEEFVPHMADAYLKWRSLDSKIDKDERLGQVSALVYSAITLHILSMKLLLSGHIVAAGNLMRQVIESIAMALLCSVPSLGILDQHIRGKYQSNKSVSQVIEHANIIGVKLGALEDLKKAQKFYHQYSHPSLFTLASHVSFDTVGALYVGCSFDEGKVDQYRKEVIGRLNLAKVFPNFIEAVSNNFK